MPAQNLSDLASQASSLGATEIRLAPGRALLFLGQPPAVNHLLQTTAAALGFVTSAADPRTRIAACPGTPACASGQIATRDIAETIAAENADILDFTLHISGCAKGCAHPGPAALTLVGGENGAGLVVNATAKALPAGYRPGYDAARGISHVAAAIRSARFQGETAAACLTRLGPAAIAETYRQEMSMAAYDYIHDGNAIYERSFAIIRAEADLSRFSEAEADVAIRMIHACGQVEASSHFVFSPDFVVAARTALAAGAPIFCDAEMVSHGVTRARLPAGNEVICTLRDPRTHDIAKDIGNTRSAAAIDLWGERMAGSVVAIGNAPTALFYLLEKLRDGAPKPAAIIGMPVGFVGAAESKDALAENSYGVPYAIVRGRLGGSAMTAAALNSLARPGL